MGSSGALALDLRTGKTRWRTTDHPVRGLFIGSTAVATIVKADGSLSAEADTVELRDHTTGSVTPPPTGPKPAPASRPRSSSRGAAGRCGVTTSSPKPLASG